MICFEVAQRSHDSHAVVIGRSSERGVLVIQVRVGAEADEELGARGIRITGPRHRKHSFNVRRCIELGVNVVSGTSHATSRRAATLNHESIDDAVKNESIVVADFGQADHVFAMAGRDIGKQVQ